MKPKLRIDVQLANAYAEGVHPTRCNIRKKTVKPSPLSKSASIQESRQLHQASNEEQMVALTLVNDLPFLELEMIKQIKQCNIADWPKAVCVHRPNTPPAVFWNSDM
jgi:hypothetical protein